MYDVLLLGGCGADRLEYPGSGTGLAVAETLAVVAGQSESPPQGLLGS